MTFIYTRTVTGHSHSCERQRHTQQDGEEIDKQEEEVPAGSAA
ncbi:hypothetical protein [Halovenus halobia]